MKKVWIDDVRVISSPSPGPSPERPSSPRVRDQRVEARSQRSHTTRPLSSTSAASLGIRSDKGGRVESDDGDRTAECEIRAVGDRGAPARALREQEQR